MRRVHGSQLAALCVALLFAASSVLAVEAKSSEKTKEKDKDDKARDKEARQDPQGADREAKDRPGDDRARDKDGKCKSGCPPPPTPTPTPAPPPPSTACAGNAKSGTGTVVFTFDDGLSNHVDAARILSSRGYCGTFYVIAGSFREGPWYTSYLSRQEVQDMSRAGQDVESHTMSHADLTTLSAAARHDELARSKAVLEEVTGKAVRHFAYPYGAYNDAVVQDTASVYVSARGAWDVPASRYTLPARCVERTDTVATVKAWVDEAVATGGTVLLCFHAIDGSGTQYAWTPAALQQVVDLVAASGASVRTVAQLGDAGLLPP